MKTKLLVLAISVSLLATSCTFYSYPEKQIVARQGEKVLGYTLVSVHPDHIRLKGAPKEPISLQKGEDYSAGNNQHLELISTDVSQKQATFEYRSLEWHGGLTLPPF